MAGALGHLLLWLALLGARVLSCLQCHTTSNQRLHACRFFVSQEGPQQLQCLQLFLKAFSPYEDLKIRYTERGNLKDSFADMLFSLEEKAVANESFETAIPEAAQHLEEAISKLKKAPDCVPPCGFQEEARRFRCDSCSSADCDLPLDCDIQDVPVLEGGRTAFNCTVSFSTPEDLRYGWKFAPNVRTRDLSYFRDLPGSHGAFARIRPTRISHRGTFACFLQGPNRRLLARLFFYVNVTSRALLGEAELQTMFRRVLDRAHVAGDQAEPWHPTLLELLARPGTLTTTNLKLLTAGAGLLAMSLTLLAG
ncbi:sperm acrosome membrane-associated protein 6 isoform X2 [Tachyglossus aculeatus]|uniref:sperm acrosome membrane-associated protein 6 isoform X1 n=1 Tax=Tachyglossus aculeatus TaxID=9261 RepID=UPI0018F6CAC4|nr:sperm acrosome membrane-associated protein 6 isoform X1 [Tachyglossus aculeatus]XP_038623386.1 sperm acrosome membrane-associated protein 6 isoform X2 [Tachyglossus aculeatus]